MNEAIRAYLSKLGRKGGRKSRRVLTSEQAKAMVAAREKKRDERLTLALKELYQQGL